jgi:hypothetical protein
MQAANPAGPASRRRRIYLTILIINPGLIRAPFCNLWTIVTHKSFLKMLYKQRCAPGAHSAMF